MIIMIIIRLDNNYYDVEIIILIIRSSNYNTNHKIRLNNIQTINYMIDNTSK